MSVQTVFRFLENLPTLNEKLKTARQNKDA